MRFREARLQAVSSRNMYSEQGLEARMGPELGQVCQSFIVVLKCRAWVSGLPCGGADLIPEIAGFEGFGDGAVTAGGEIPIAV